MQPLLSSSYGSWGVASLDQDAGELLLLLTYLRSHQHSQVSSELYNKASESTNAVHCRIIVAYMASAFAMCLWEEIPPPVLSFPKPLTCIAQGVVIIGHSTGCQDAVRYVARHKEAADAARLLGIILQAPVNFESPLSARCDWCIR